MSTTFLKRLLALVLSFLIPALSFTFTRSDAARKDAGVKAALEKTGGLVKGVCHADDNYDLLRGCNIEWERSDIPYPFNDDGSVSLYYQWWKAEAQRYLENGIRVFAVTPYPHEFIAHGLDPRNPDDREAIQDVARFFVEDLKDVVGIFQVSNELSVDRFRAPLTLDEAAEFIGMQLEVMKPLCDKYGILVGYNLTASVEQPFIMLQYNHLVDYVGLDCYIGCFEDILHETDTFTLFAGAVRQLTGKPILFCEFGYIGEGEPKGAEGKAAILREYGYNSEEEATADMANFLQKLPPRMRDEILELYPNATDEEYAQMLFEGEYKNHLYRDLPDGYYIDGCPHTPEGQGTFYAEVIPKLFSLDYVIGAVVYCWSDSDTCYVCGQDDCPVETRWGIVTRDGTPKPAYYAIQKAFAEAV